PHLSHTPSFLGGVNLIWYIWPQAAFLQVRRPVSRVTRASSSTSMEITWSILLPRPISTVSNASAWGTVRGKPSRIKPFWQSGCARRSLMMPMTTASGTSLPASMYSLAFRPISVPALTAARRMSPVEIWGIPYLSMSFFAWVPFPAPGPPNRIRFISFSFLRSASHPAHAFFHETLVMAGEQMRFDLSHGIHGHPHHNQQGRAPEIKGDVELANQDTGQHADRRNVRRAPQGDAGENPVDIFRGGFPGP